MFYSLVNLKAVECRSHHAALFKRLPLLVNLGNNPISLLPVPSSISVHFFTCAFKHQCSFLQHYIC